MTFQILQTKLHIPSAHSGLVFRSRLIEKLNRSLETDARLLLVAAPAGSGKTSLLDSWIHQTGAGINSGGGIHSENAFSKLPQFAWLSLDADDNDPVRFWTYMFAALKKRKPDLEDAFLYRIHSNPFPSLTDLLTPLINALSNAPASLVLILDDYHLITNDAIHAGMRYWLDHLTESFLLVIATRVDPPLPIVRLRARRQVIEIRMADLRFLPQEAGQFFDRAMGLDLTTEQVETLDTITEGWAVGLQMAGLSLQSHENSRTEFSSFQKTFAGSNRFIIDYFMEEVLTQQPAEIQSFLLETSILDRVCAELADTVRQDASGSSQQILARLEQANLFLIALDDERRWYRYHHLFADLLRSRLKASAAGKRAPLHMRASQWFEQEGLLSEAFHHAQLAGDPERMADIAEQNWVPVMHEGQIDTGLDWLKAIPVEIFLRRPILDIAEAWGLCLKGDLAQVDFHLVRAEKSLAKQIEQGTVLPENEVFRRIPAEVALVRSLQSRMVGNLPASMEWAIRASELAVHVNELLQGNALVMLANTYRELGRYPEAIRTYRDSIQPSWTGKNLVSVMGSYSSIARLQVMQGALKQAEATVLEGLQFAAENGAGQMPAASILHLVLAGIYTEWNRLDEARAAMDQGLALGKGSGQLEFEKASALARAKLAWAEGAPQEALDTVEQAVQIFHKLGAVMARDELEAVQAGQAARLGLLDQAAIWAKDFSPISPETPGYTRVIENLNYARVQIALGQEDSVMELLAGLLEESQKAGLLGNQIECLLLRSAASLRLAKTNAAMADLDLAQAIGKPAQYQRVFIDHNEWVQALLGGSPASPKQQHTANIHLDEPLTERELEVLALIGAGLSNQQIAERLFLTVATVKKHTSSILGKLSAANRTQAIAVARQQGIL